MYVLALQDELIHLVNGQLIDHGQIDQGNATYRGGIKLAHGLVRYVIHPWTSDSTGGGRRPKHLATAVYPLLLEMACLVRQAFQPGHL